MDCGYALLGVNIKNGIYSGSYDDTTDQSAIFEKDSTTFMVIEQMGYIERYILLSTESCFTLQGDNQESNFIVEGFGRRTWIDFGVYPSLSFYESNLYTVPPAPSSTKGISFVFSIGPKITNFFVLKRSLFFSFMLFACCIAGACALHPVLRSMLGSIPSAPQIVHEENNGCCWKFGAQVLPGFLTGLFLPLIGHLLLHVVFCAAPLTLLSSYIALVFWAMGAGAIFFARNDQIAAITASDFSPMGGLFWAIGVEILLVTSMWYSKVKANRNKESYKAVEDPAHLVHIQEKDNENE